VIVTGLAVAAFLLFGVSVIRDPRDFVNAVLLGVTLALFALAGVERLAEDPERKARLLLDLLLVLTAAGPFLVAGFLIVNGIALLRREHLRPANLLSLALGLAFFAAVALTFAAVRLGSFKFTLATGIIDMLFGYVSFLLISYVTYAFLYGRMATLLTGADFIVVLGAGLKRDGTPTPLLARRLDRALRVRTALSRGDAVAPVIVVSGGKGADERISEARSMFGYLTPRGVSPESVLLEDRSRTTEENLRFSKAIMDSVRPDTRCVIVTSNFHVFRAAMLARRLGLRGQVTGAPVAGYYWPSAMLREFAAVFLTYRLVNSVVCLLIVAAPLAYVGLHRLL
jgi:uncharacterized SAM-binding protein YcdF (DUF218 family)